MVDRSVAPPFVAPQKFTLPKPEVITLTNGSRCIFLKSGTQPVVRMEFIFRAGSWFEHNPGEAYFTARLLGEGTASFSSEQIAARLDQFGAFTELNAGFDYLSLTVYVPSGFVNNITDVVREILFAPVFPEKELELMQNIEQNHLSVKEGKNNFMASRKFRAGLYPGHPYGHVISKAAIEQITPEVLKKHYEQWVRGKYELCVTGWIDDELKESILDIFGQNMLKIHEFTPLAEASVQPFDDRTDRLDSVQSAIFMGRRSVHRTDRDFARLQLLNEVFGGYFGSRLMQNIREDKGYTYGIYSHFVTLRNDTYFVISGEVNKESKENALREIEKEIDRICREPIGMQELLQAKNSLKGSLANSLTSAFSLMDRLKQIYYYNLPDNYYDHLFDEIDQATPEDLMILAKDRLFCDALSKVLVG